MFCFLTLLDHVLSKFLVSRKFPPGGLGLTDFFRLVRLHACSQSVDPWFEPSMGTETVEEAQLVGYIYTHFSRK